MARANTAIEEMISSKSDVELNVVVDSISPWVIIGQDSIYNPSDNAKLTIEYESENIVELYIGPATYYSLTIDGEVRDPDWYENGSYTYIEPGKHVVIVTSKYKEQVIHGISMKQKVFTDDDANGVLALLEKTTSEVELKIMNDSYAPWIVKDNTIRSVKNSPGSALSFLYTSTCQTEIRLRTGGELYCYIDGVKNYEATDGETNVLYLAPGTHIITFESIYDYSASIHSFSIHEINTSEMEEMIESKSEVDVEVINDSVSPWIMIGVDSLSATEKNAKISIKYSSMKRTEICISWLTYRPTIFIDGVLYEQESYKVKNQFFNLDSGEHVLQLICPEKQHYTRYDYIVNSIIINEIDTHEFTRVGFITPLYPEYFYDFDEDGVMEWYNSNKIYDVNLKDYKTSLYDGHSDWWNLNNDMWLDGYYFNYGKLNTYLSDSLYKYIQNDFSNVENNYYLDYNNDGYPDIIDGVKAKSSDHQTYAYTFLSDSGYVKSKVNLISADEYNNISIRKNRSGIVGQSLSQALSYQNVVRATPSDGRNIKFTNVDFNGDGIEDCYTKTKVLQNCGDGTIVEHELSGDFVDIDNNGIMDAISYDDGNIIIYKMNRDWSYTEYTIYSGAAFDHFWCYDFDKDNDKDILLAFDYTQKLGGSYLILLSATDDGGFEPHEYFYENKYTFTNCIDINADGYYEIFCSESIDDKDYDKIAYFEIEGVHINESPSYFKQELAKTSYRKCNHNVLDIDNDGIMELSMSAPPIELSTNSYEHYYYLVKLSDMANARPSRPNKPSVVYERSTGELAITWEEGSDKESSPVDLTYALRIGTEPGKGDIVYAHAMADGTRKNLMGGNQSTNRYRRLNTNTWKAGKYYISIQVIDPNNRGSEFSEEVIFEKKNHAASFSMQYVSPFGVGDTCTIQLHHNVSAGVEFSLNASNGRIVDTCLDNASYKVVFDEPGLQTVALTAKNSDGQNSTVYEEAVMVRPISMTKIESDSRITLALDMDEDGLLEYFVDKEGFHEVNTEGIYNRINKMYNNHTLILDAEYVQPDYAVDINKDGKADVFANISHFNSGSWFTMLNSGNKSMAINADPIKFNFYISDLYGLVDMNNDGNLDIVAKENYETSIYSSQNSFTEFVRESWIKNVKAIRDFDGDGQLDVLVEEGNNELQKSTYYIYKNKSAFEFVRSAPLFERAYDESFAYIKDFDNDGLWDFVVQKKKEYYVRWGNGDITKLESITSIAKMPLVNIGEPIFDFNNDGYWDINAEGGIYDEGGILLFLPNHQYQFIGGYESDLSNIPFVLPNGDIRKGDLVCMSDNHKPKSPTGVSVIQKSDGVYIRWNHSADKETPECNMRYNISVKHKGNTGNGAYLISPCNSTKNGVHIPSTLKLIDGNLYFIPISSIPVGEYQVQIQGVDMQNQESDFSDVVEFEVRESCAFDIPTIIEEGMATTIKVLANVSAEIDWDGGEIISSDGNKYNVVWNSAGSKVIKVGDYAQRIYVSSLPSAEFSLPAKVLQKSTVRISVNNAKNGEWSVSADKDEFVGLSEMDIDILSVDSVSMLVRFNNSGEYIIRNTLKGELTNVTYEQMVEVSNNNVAPYIHSVFSKDNYYHILWDCNNDIPEEVIGYRLYKETSYANKYELIYEGDLTNTLFVDSTSNASQSASRYALSYVTNYGESCKSNVHQGLHVMINQGIMNTWNLAWKKYEGRDVSSYRIWAGTSASDLKLIGEISGNLTSYTDPMTDETCYYAVETIFEDDNIDAAETRGASSIESNLFMSNVVSTISASQISAVESILIIGNDIDVQLTESTQIYAYVYPYYASYQGVNWDIIEGSELATINSNGLLVSSGNGNGEVIVRAYALDGTGIYADKTIIITGYPEIPNSIEIIESKQPIANKKILIGNKIYIQKPDGTLYDLMGRKVISGK